MRTLVIIIGGIVLAGIFAVVGRAVAGQPGLTRASRLFLVAWLLLTLANMWLGVSHGYSVMEELPIALGIFIVPAIASFILVRLMRR